MSQQAMNLFNGKMIEGSFFECESSQRFFAYPVYLKLQQQ